MLAVPSRGKGKTHFFEVSERRKVFLKNVLQLSDYANEAIVFNCIPEILLKFNYLPPPLTKLKQTTPSRALVMGTAFLPN